MPAMDDLLMLETQSERLGLLWRSQGQAFLDEQAAELQDDVDRLRAAYLAGAKSFSAARPRPRRPVFTPKVIDLTEYEVTGTGCTTDGHGHEFASTRCSRCKNAYCDSCILLSQATRGRPLCTECALIVAGVHHKRIRLVR